MQFIRKWFATYLKGMAMGAADVVPGVSGGTIAFISGIYDTLLESIRRINPSLIGRLRDKGLVDSYQHVNGTFLIVLVTGILTSIFTFAKIISHLLVTQPILIWSFFFGLILVSVWHILRQIENWQWHSALFGLAGAVLAYGITVIHPIQLSGSLPTIFIGGAIAICAMILPGISGSFILLLLGLYPVVLGAVKSLDLVVIATFAVGGLTGLLTFSHLLSWLLKRARDLTLIFLTGLMIGTLGKVWPWKEVLTWRTNSKGEQVPLTEQNLLPWEFADKLAQDPQTMSAILAMLAAIGLVLALEAYAARQKQA
ncbi:DUF368 domain-containing protein [Paraferrimonas sedimenticola]|uniref:DUF368 domain-containing protein n=1 Tax=Paraferrimonas sedimenticola TaxID=375674 RepID=A0AA37RX31_9GAMM|nr:DUF368 domain-containing protein [Paraferrimonas sedimenticola]GLP97265.1 DUF368 domain-containing protein [Paraferrimonas sedimenticola]